MIRRYEPADLDAVTRICILTGDAGSDATGQPGADDLPRIYLHPYLPDELAWVAVDDLGVAGYLVATTDSVGFAASRPEQPPIPEVADFPAHLHINLLPRAQGQGLGRALIDVLVDELERRGIRGVHLGVDAANTGARAFYERLGFVELPSSTTADPRYGRTLNP